MPAWHALRCRKAFLADFTAPCGSLLLLAVQSARICERKAETLLLGNTRYPSGCSTWSSIHFCWSNSTGFKPSKLLVCVTTGREAVKHHLPLSEIDEPLGLARGRQVSPVSIEQQLPLLFFGESATQLLQVQRRFSGESGGRVSCDHKPLTYEESSTRGCVAPSPLYTRRNIANTSELSAGALPRRVLERNMSSNTTNSATT